MEAAISQICTLRNPFAADVADYADAGCPVMELWLGKLESHLESQSLRDTVQLLKDKGVRSPVASFQGGLLSSGDESRQAHWDHFRRRLDWCGPLGIQTVVAVFDFPEPTDAGFLGQVSARIHEAVELAARCNVRLAWEFQGRSPFANNLRTAVSLVEQIGHPNLGLCWDAYHYYVGPSKTEDLPLLTRDNLFHVQLCDLSGVPREWAADADRILPGDGEIPLEPTVDLLRAMGYEGVVSLELMNPLLWNIPARQLAEVGVTALRKCLGLASMG